MLDIKLIKDNPDLIKKSMQNRGREDLEIVDELIALDDERIKVQKSLDDLRSQKNNASKEITKNPEDKDKIIEKIREIDGECDRLDKEMRELLEKIQTLIYKIPNLPVEDVPLGKDDTENVTIKEWGEKPNFDFEPKEHFEIGEELGIIDTKTSSKISGSRFTYLKGDLVLLQFALISFTMSVITSEEKISEIIKNAELDIPVKPFIPVIPPDMIRPDVYKRMARLSDEDKDERYYLEKDDLYLIGSAEHTLGPMYIDSILTENDLPLRFVGYSSCFRREAGSYGKDTKGILRLHQFDKIEMETFSLPEDGIKEQQLMVAIQEYLTQKLNIPYRVVYVCTGDMGTPDAKQIDIEMWMPGQNKYRETHSADYVSDYQSRRLQTRVRRKDSSIDYVHMNDATAFAIGRTLIAIIENYQQKDGTIKIPEILVPYMGGKTSIKQL